MTYCFSVGGWGFDDGYEFESSWDDEHLEYVVEDAAEYYHDNCDGHDDTWPLVFTLWSAIGDILGTFKVEREYDPTFSASVIGEESDDV